MARAIPRHQRLTVDEYARLAKQFDRLGIDKVRFTGGEPLLRPEILDIVSAFRDNIPKVKLALTTNGQKLPSLIEPLAERGLSGITVHIDSLKPERYRRLMGPGDVGEVIQTVLRAQERIETVKLNVVVQRAQNDDELNDFLDWSKQTGIEVRFIELMNTGSAMPYTKQCFISGREIIQTVEAKRQTRRLPRRSADDPAALFETSDGVIFGLIASDTEPFCSACTRLRLSPDGRLRGCLYEAGGAPLMAALREGATDVDLAKLMNLAVSQKQSHHPSLPMARKAFSMADVGG